MYSQRKQDGRPASDLGLSMLTSQEVEAWIVKVWVAGTSIPVSSYQLHEFWEAAEFKKLQVNFQVASSCLPGHLSCVLTPAVLAATSLATSSCNFLTIFVPFYPCVKLLLLKNI